MYRLLKKGNESAEMVKMETNPLASEEFSDCMDDSNNLHSPLDDLKLVRSPEDSENARMTNPLVSNEMQKIDDRASECLLCHKM